MRPVTTANFRGLVLFVTLQKQFPENINKSYHVFKVIVVLHIDNIIKFWVSD